MLLDHLSTQGIYLYQLYFYPGLSFAGQQSSIGWSGKKQNKKDETLKYRTLANEERSYVVAALFKLVLNCILSNFYFYFTPVNYFG